eukprot:58004_1
MNKICEKAKVQKQDEFTQLRLYKAAGRKNSGPTVEKENIESSEWQNKFGKNNQTTLWVGFAGDKGFKKCELLWKLASKSIKQNYSNIWEHVNNNMEAQSKIKASDFFKKQDADVLMTAQMALSRGVGLSKKDAILSAMESKMKGDIKNCGFVGRGAVPKQAGFLADYIRNVDPVKPRASFKKGKKKRKK